MQTPKVFRETVQTSGAGSKTDITAMAQQIVRQKNLNNGLLVLFASGNGVGISTGGCECGSVTLPVQGGKLPLGNGQTIQLCDRDAAQKREVVISVIDFSPSQVD